MNFFLIQYMKSKANVSCGLPLLALVQTLRNVVNKGRISEVRTVMLLTCIRKSVGFEL